LLFSIQPTTIILMNKFDNIKKHYLNRQYKSGSVCFVVSQIELINGRIELSITLGSTGKFYMYNELEQLHQLREQMLDEIVTIYAIAVNAVYYDSVRMY
jgi:hypothetical protein